MRKCEICGADITDKRYNAKYCSEHCLRTAEKKKRIGYITERANRINKVKMLVYEAYKHRCAICEWQISNDLLVVNGKYQYAHGNEIHHIVPVNQGGGETDGNLILLCPNHHKLADLGLITPDELCAKTVRFTKTQEEIESDKAKNGCSDAIARAIFG